MNFAHYLFLVYPKMSKNENFIYFSMNLKVRRTIWMKFFSFLFSRLRRSYFEAAMPTYAVDSRPAAGAGCIHNFCDSKKRGSHPRKVSGIQIGPNFRYDNTQNRICKGKKTVIHLNTYCRPNIAEFAHIFEKNLRNFTIFS